MTSIIDVRSKLFYDFQDQKSAELEATKEQTLDSDSTDQMPSHVKSIIEKQTDVKILCENIHTDSMSQSYTLDRPLVIEESKEH